MKRAAYLTGLILALALGAMSLATTSLAQERAWVQIEAKPSLVQAEDRARAWSTGFGNVSGYWLESGWYGIVLGPYSPAEAAADLAELKRRGMIPPDSFVTDGRNFRDAFWTADSRRTSTAGRVRKARPRPANPKACSPPSSAAICKMRSAGLAFTPAGPMAPLAAAPGRRWLPGRGPMAAPPPAF
jgi:hypothetical protein